MMTTKIHPNLMSEQTTSISPKTVTAPTLIKMMTIQKTVIQTATGTLSVQNDKTVTTPWYVKLVRGCGWRQCTHLELVRDGNAV
jgi:hypothetical protein